MTEPLITIETLAAELDLSEQTVQAWTARGCPAYVIGRSRRFRLTEVAAWAADRVEPPATDDKPARQDKPAARLRPLRQGFVYFIGARRRSPIKVGWSGRIEGRVPSLQTGCWEELTCHGAVRGTLADEAAVHERLAEHRVRGEWFERDAALALLADLQAGKPGGSR